jgi:hypothetical protein
MARKEQKTRLKAEGTSLELTDYLLPPHKEAEEQYIRVKDAMETLGIEPYTPEFYEVLESSGLHIEHWRRFERQEKNN